MTLWVYQRTAAGKFNRVPQRIVTGFFSFEAVIPPIGSDEFVFLATYTVKVKNRKPIALLGEHFTKYRVSREGKLDADHWDDAKRVAIASLDLGRLMPRLPTDDGKVIGYSQMMQRRDQAQHRWNPTNDDLLALGYDLAARGLSLETAVK